jgi:glycosyltransferase involved in cell wall biosynthesis
MRVLFVSPFPPDQDGVGTYSQTMITTLKAMGNEAKVILPRAQADQSEDIIGVLGRRQDDLSLLCSKVAIWNPDVIHVQFAVATFGIQTRNLLSWLRLIRTAINVPVFVTMHEVTRDTAALRGPGRALYRALANRCDQMIVHTQSSFDTLTRVVKTPEAKVRIIPHPEAKPPRPASTPEEIRDRFGLRDKELLVAFGFIHVDKGLGDLVQALRILRESEALAMHKLRLVIAGTVRPRSGLFRLFEWRDRLHLARILRIAHASMLDRNIVLTGYVPEDDVAAWFQAASAIVLPYRRTEQSGVAALANAFGVPVLASTVGGLGEQYTDSRWNFPPRDPVKLARVISQFFTEAPGKECDSAPARSAADISSVVKTTLSLYHAKAKVHASHSQMKSSPHTQ